MRRERCLLEDTAECKILLKKMRYLGEEKGAAGHGVQKCHTLLHRCNIGLHYHRVVKGIP